MLHTIDLTREFRYDDGHTKVVATVKYGDSCGNGHNTFTITADVREGWHSSCGCCHEMVAKYLPELAPFIKWHLCSTDGPLHYVANTCYHAGDKDCWGGRKGEVRAYRYDVLVNGGLVFNLGTDEAFRLPDLKDAEAMANRLDGEVVAVPRLLHEGKERDLDAARRCAIWPDATDAQLTEPGLSVRLLARLPQLLEDFKQAVESFGFEY